MSASLVSRPIWRRRDREHRKEARAAGRREGIEAAAKVADEERKASRKSIDIYRRGYGDDTASAIATAIRALSAQPTEETK